MKLRALALVALLCLGASTAGTADAATASWGLEPSSFDFGVRPPAEGSTRPQAFELRNTGEASLDPEFITVSSRGETSFRLAGSDCRHQLAPGAGCTIEVTFGPQTEGRKEGTLTVETSTPNVPAATAQLFGSGGEPVVVITPPAVTFDTVTIPFASVSTGGSKATVTVTNAGSAPLTIQGFGYKEEAAALATRSNFFILGGSAGPGRCGGQTLAPAGSCVMDLEFGPQEAGTYQAQLELEDFNSRIEGPLSRQIIPLYGTAVSAPPPSFPPRPPGPTLASSVGFVKAPHRRTRSRGATFAFSTASSPLGFECQSELLERFRACTSPVHLTGLKTGRHYFSVRAVGSNGTPGPVATYHWRILKPKPKPKRR